MDLSTVAEATPLKEEMGPTEDVFQALLDQLVAPLLPWKSSARQIPSLSHQQEVAKQMHAVVILYNYYQRKHHPNLEFLGFESCCKLAVILKPTLMAHMKLMRRSDYTEVDDLESQLSLTEKAIMDACDISTALDVTKDVPCTDGWPISKVTVLLVDSRKENCLLLYDSITNGICSVIERDLDASIINSGSIVNQKFTSNGKKPSGIVPRDELLTNEAALQQLAFSAVKELAGINQTDLIVLESHVVYSLSKEKSAARFFIVQSSQSISEDLLVPVKDAVESLQGPLFEKSFFGWRVTPVVEYFHVLPYAGILSDWLSRELSSKILRVKIENVNMDSSNRIEVQHEASEDENISIENFGVIDVIKNDAYKGNSESPKQKDNNECGTTCSSDSVNGLDKVDVDNSLLVCTQKKDKIKNTYKSVKVSDHEKKMTASKNSDIDALTSGKSNEHNCVTNATNIRGFSGDSEYPKKKNNDGCEMACFSNFVMDVDNSLLVGTQNEEKIKDTSNAVEVNDQNKGTASIKIDKHASASSIKLTEEITDSPMELCIIDDQAEILNIQNKNGRNSSSGGDYKASGDHAAVSHQLNSKCTEMVMVTLASKENALSQTALKVLRQKREKLSLQQRSLAEELALCDEQIQKILDGGEDDLALKIQAMIDGCNDVCLKSTCKSRDRACQHYEDPVLSTKRKRLSDAILTMQNPCQELDAICCMNNWILPTYFLSPSNDEFLAKIIIKGVDFELSERSELKSSPHGARESAAAGMIAKLKGIVAKK